MAKYIIETAAPLQENSQKFEYLISSVKSSPESQSSNIPIKPHNYKKDCLLSVDNENLEPFSPRTQSMIDELEQHVDELANSNDQISIIDSPREVLTKSDVILESNSIPLNINIQKDSEDDIWQYFNSISQSFSLNDPSEKIGLNLDTASISIKNVIIDQDNILVHIKLLNFDSSRRLDSNAKKSIRLMIGQTTYHTKPSTSLEDQLKKSFLFPFNYHSLIFDTMKLVIYEYGSFLNKKRKYGRVIVRLNALKQTIINHGEFEKTFPIEANLHEIGAVQVNIKLHFPNDPPFSPQTLSSSIQSPLIQNTRDYFDDSIETQSDAISLGILGTVLSKETRDAIREITALYHAFFGHGWRLTKLEFFKAYMLLEKYYRNLSYDINMMEDALRYLQFSMASYGSFLFNWFGYGPRNAFGMTSDKKIVRNFFNLEKSDVICWEYGQKTVSVPNYMVIRDPKTNSIFICIRGSLSITDLITDALAYFELWNGSFVHRGAFRSAQYLVDQSLEKIKDAVAKYKVKSIKIMGHSLGASISSLATLLLRERCKDLLDSGIDICSWNFATFPCCSLDLASKADTMKCIINFVNENDVISRLSYGNLMDFKELVKFAATELKNNEYKELKSKQKLAKIFTSIDAYRKTLKSNSHSQKLYIPGTIYYLYKRTDNFQMESYFPSNNKDVVCEESKPDFFTDICLRKNWLFHHFPDRYDKKFKGVIKFLTKEMNKCALGNELDHVLN
ncbi:24627_t:CDS:10 [Racocetra persica]|uniref:24627_t:CDS:1 n=1 Tax=Racocetra persica TaxID=160502 RepID=A0ACA9KMF5_9GLOM|nr:24627_t:CDS:10 [Racocetra persica]